MTTTATPATARPARLDLALLLLRAVVGVVFAAHGGQKLFVMGIGNVTGFFTQAGVPLPAVSAPLVAGIEFFGGIALVLGLLTRLVGLGLAIDMLGAILIVHLPNGFFLPMGVEFVLTLGAVAATLALTGAGRYSVDHAIAARRAGR
jgi:putative oxidoreductase